MTKLEKEYFTTQKVAKWLDVTTQTVVNLIKRGELKANKIGKVYRISAEDLTEFLRKTETVQEKSNAK